MSNAESTSQLAPTGVGLYGSTFWLREFPAGLFIGSSGPGKLGLDNLSYSKPGGLGLMALWVSSSSFGLL